MDKKRLVEHYAKFPTLIEIDDNQLFDSFFFKSNMFVYRYEEEENGYNFNDDPVEESPENRQAENDKEDRDDGSFDDGRRAISHVPPAGDQSHVANSLLEQSTPGDVAAPTKQGQREKEFAKGKQEETSTTDETDLLDHGLTLIGHVVPLGKSHYDTEATDDF